MSSSVRANHEADQSQDVLLSKHLRDFAGKTQKPEDHFKAVAIQEVAKAGADAKFSLRAVVSKSGYGFSTFYRFWKGFDEYLLDTYDLAVESFLDAEQKMMDEFCGSTPREFFEMLAEHNLAGNRLVPKGLLRSILITFLKGRVSRILRHSSRQAEAVARSFDQHFADQNLSVDVERLKAVFQVHGTFLYWRLADEGLEQDVRILRELMVDSALMTVISSK